MSVVGVELVGARARARAARSTRRVALGWQRLSRLDRAALVLVTLVTVAAVVGPWLAPHDPVERVGDSFLPPGRGGFLLGTDQSGRDVWSRTLWGVRSTWLSAVGVIAAAAAFGAVVGAYAGAGRGWLDAVLMRVTDFFLALPGPLVAIAVVAGLGPGLWHSLVAVGVVWWPWYARIVRNEVRALSVRPHVEAARLAGARPGRLRRRHLLPGALPPLIVAATLDVGTLIMSLTALSFLGLGAPPPAPELGAMVGAGSTYVLDHPWLTVVPSVAVALMTFAASVAGDAVGSLVGVER